MKKTNSNISWYAAGIVSVVLLILFDQWTKLLAVNHLQGKEDIILIPNVLQLHYLENRGAAFGILQGQIAVFVVLCAVFLAVGMYFYIKIPKTKHYLPLAVMIVAIAAGGIGNLIDRIRLNYVVDFIYASFIDFPIFNVADIYVTVATFCLVFFVLFFYKDEDFDFMKKDRETNGEL